MDSSKRDMIEYFRRNGRNSSSTILHYAGKENCAANQSFGPATRAQYLLHFITHGKGTFRVNGRTYTLSENQVFLIKPGVRTFYQADGQEPWSYMWFAFSAPDAEIILQNCGFLRSDPFVSYPFSPQLYSCLQSIIDRMERQSCTDYDILADMYRVFAYLTQCHRQNEVVRSGNPYLIQAVDFIANNYSFPIRVGHIADFVGLDRTYLYRLFEQELHISPKKYLTDYRLQVSKDLLANSELSIDVISQRCGFTDSSSFSKTFRQAFWLSPLKYRKMDGEQYLSWKKEDSREELL